MAEEEEMEYYVGRKTGEEYVPGAYPAAGTSRRDVWHMQGPMDKGYALNCLQRLTKAHGEPNVQLFVSVPWHACVSVSSDCNVRFEYPGDREAEAED